MWIASVPAAAPALPGAAPAAAPSGEAAPFDEALDASLQGQPVRENVAAARQLLDQRALAAWLLGSQVSAAVPAPEAEAIPSETGVEIDEDLDRAVGLDGDAEAEIQTDVLFVAPVPQQPVAEPTVQIAEAAAERNASGDARLMPVVTGNVQDARLAQDAAPAAAETAKAAEPQIVRLKPEATVIDSDGTVTPEATPKAEAAENREGAQGAEPSALLEGNAASMPAVTHPVAKRHVAAAKAPMVPVASVAEPRATEATAPAAEAAAGAPAQREERSARDTTIAMSRGLVSGPAAVQVQTQMGGGDAQTFEQDGRRSPAAQRLAAALSMAAPGSTRDTSTAAAPVFAVPGQPAAAPAPIAAPVVMAAPAPTQVDAENVHTLVQAMRVTAKAGGWEATVRLKPEHMGEVTIALRVDGKNVSAVVQAESAGVRQWLMSQEDAVRSGMSEHGLQLDRFTVSRDGQRREAEEQQPQQQQPRRRAPQPNGQDQPRFEIVV